MPASKKGEFGFSSVWTWTAIDADTKLVPCWMIGPRDAATATEFMQDGRSPGVNEAGNARGPRFAGATAFDQSVSR